MKKLFPALQWLPQYKLNLFGSDTISGITLAAYAIPVSLAYATLAGLPPQYGIYGYLLGGLFYALLGSSKHLAVGPTSAISLLIGTTLAGFANGDTQHWLDLASLTALVFACMSVLAYLLRLSSIINFISENILLGFKAGAALTIALTQLPKLFGVKGGGEDFWSRLTTLVHQIPDTNTTVLLFGIIAIALFIAGEKLLPGKPVALGIVIISIIIMATTTLGESGFKTVGIIPAGLPEFRIPNWTVNDVDNVIPLAFACFLLAYIESVSAAKTIAQKNEYEIDARQELLALGVANLATSFGGGYPVSGGLSQSAVNEKAGAKTPISLIIASLTIGICLLFFTELLKTLPTVILACIVLVAVRGLIDYKELNRLRKVNRFDFFIAICSLLSVIIFGIFQGVLIAAMISLVLIIKSASAPHVAFLGKIPGTNRYTDMERHPDNEVVQGVLLFRVEADLLYFNVSYIYQTIMNKVSECGPELKVVIQDLSTSPYIDSSGAKLIKRLCLELESKGIIYKIAEAHSEVRDILRTEEIDHLIGHVSRRDSIHDVVLESVNANGARH